MQSGMIYMIYSKLFGRLENFSRNCLQNVLDYAALDINVRKGLVKDSWGVTTVQ